MTTTIDELLLLGDDQIKSQASVIFVPSTGLSGKIGAYDDTYSMRMDQSIDLPKVEVGTYEAWYQGKKILKRSIIENTDTVTKSVKIEVVSVDNKISKGVKLNPKSNFVVLKSN